MISRLILIGESITAKRKLRAGIIRILACTPVALGRGEQQALYGWWICKFLLFSHVFPEWLTFGIFTVAIYATQFRTFEGRAVVDEFFSR